MTSPPAVKPRPLGASDIVPGRLARTAPFRDDQEYAHLDPVLARYAGLCPDSPSRRPLRNELVAGFFPLAQHLAHRFAYRGVPPEDLVQVAAIGLIASIDRYDPTYGRGFLAYAVPTIRGELRRYFRDHTWSARVPRRLKELSAEVREASAALSAELHRAPRPSELARRLDVSTQDVLDVLQAAQAYTSASLDEKLASAPEQAGTLNEALGRADARLETVEHREVLRPLLAELPARERDILVLRFFADLTQTQIAEKMGISQMHVSRLLQQTLTQLRTRLQPDTDPPGAH